MNDIQHNLFATPIWGAMLNDHQFQSTDYVDYILEMAKNEPSVRKSNFGGWQSRDNIHQTEGIFRELVKSITFIANNIVKDYKCQPIEIKEMWANVNTKACYNGSHTHSGIISGAFYLSTPENCGKLVLINPVIRSDRHIIRANNFGITPKKLACIFFPAWLEHYVEPNMSDEYRISMSFNMDTV